MINRQFITIAAISGATGVALGAFGAHALKNILTSEMMAVYQTAVQYQMIHALGLLATGILGKFIRSDALKWAGGAFIAGMILFSGSLYLLSLTGVRALGMVTPLGGVSFIIGWLALALAGWKHEYR